MALLIKGLQKLSLIDYPEKLCATIFVGHCNFRCAYCYNVDLILHATKITTITEDWILDFLANRKKFLDGLCVGGGEPTLQKALPRFLTRVKDLGYAIKLDTNGSRPAMLRKLIDNHLIDYCAMDVKAPFRKYAKVTCTPVDLTSIQRSIEILNTSNIDYEFRTTIAPEILSIDDVIELANELRSARRYVLQQFIPGRTLDASLQRQYSPKTLEEIQSRIASYFQECLLRC